MSQDHPAAAASAPLTLDEAMLPLLDMFSDCVVVTRHGFILYANSALVREQDAQSRDELVGLHVQDLVVPEERARVLQRIAELRATGVKAPIEYSGITRRGGVKPVEVRESPVVFRGEVVWLSVVRDLSDRKVAEEEARRIQRLDTAGRLAGGIAHDFSSLLAVIQGYSELLLADGGMTGPRRGLLTEIHEASSKASALARRLLSFSRMEVHRPTPCNLDDLVQGFLPTLRKLLGPAFRIRTALGGVAGRQVHADPGQVEQILLNLALNARDAMPGGGTLDIATSEAELEPDHPSGLPPGRYACLEISDTGVGMTEAVAARATEPFFTTKAASGGTGLGLSTVVDLVRLHRGAFLLESRPGNGARATSWLPLLESLQPLPPSAPEPSLGRVSETVLLVDDEPALREVLRLGLAAKGYRVLEAANGLEALDVLEARGHEVQLLVTDIVMPSMNGVQLAEEVERRLPGLPVLLITGYSDQAPEREGRPLPLLVKPFRIGELASRIREMLDERRAADQKYTSRQQAVGGA